MTLPAAEIFKAYDIRGIVDKTLTADAVRAIGHALGSEAVLRKQKAIAVGRDGRASSQALEAALVDGLTSSGIDAVRIGLGPTPMLYFAEAELDVDGGIMITGSHNPANYNGFKMVMFGNAFFGQDIQKLGAMAAEGDWVEGRGSVSDEQVLDLYVERLMQNFDGRGFRIGWDAGNGAAEVGLPADAGTAREDTPDQPAVHEQHEHRDDHLRWAP